MKFHFHALFSIFLIFIAIVIGVFSTAAASPIFGGMYAVLTTVSLLILFYSYCSKCACRLDGCLHVIPGLMTRILPRREGGRYHALDYAGLIVPFLLIVAFPQPWLWPDKTPFFIFWTVSVFAVAEIYLFVCRDCGNANCPRYSYLAGRNANEAS